MITLITGMPGCGKSLLMVHEFLRDAQEKGRVIVADGIPDLVIEHELAPEVSQWTNTVEDAASQDGEKLLFTFPEGALVVIDECQRVFRPRRAGSAVPPEVAAFETHRHQGLDFVLVTQHPGLLDANVRRLVGRHLHVRDLGILGRKVYEWPEATEPDKFRSAPVQRGWRLPKSSFSLYKSSSLHIKPKRGIPKGFLALAIAVPLIGAMSFYAWSSIQKKIAPPVAVVSPVVAGPGGGGQVSAAGPVVDPAALLMEFAPVVPGRPETAPAYDALRVVANMPVVAGCVQLSARCACQNQQGTDAGLDDMQCKAWLKNPPFDAYREQVAKLPGREQDKTPDARVQPGRTGDELPPNPAPVVG